jgi:3-oxoacyl-[acyl-carrier-protein] synthase-3
LETIVDTNDEWITRTGIKERRILKDADKGTSYLAIKAAQDLLKGNVDPLDIDLIIMEQLHQICQLLRLEFMWLPK